MENTPKEEKKSEESIELKKEGNSKDWELYEEGEVSFNSDTYDILEKHIHGPSREIKFSDGNGRSIHLSKKEENNFLKKNSAVIGLVLTFVIQLIALTVFFTISNERSKEVPGILEDMQSLSVAMTSHEEQIKQIYEITPELKYIKNEISAFKVALSILNDLVERVNKIQDSVEVVKQGTSKREFDIESLRVQVERVTIEQDQLRTHIESASSDRFRGRDWDREKTSLDERRRSDLELINIKFKTLEEKVNEIHDLLHQHGIDIRNKRKT